MGATIVLCALTVRLAKTQHRWPRLSCQIIFIGLIFIATLMTLAAAIGFWQTGTIPRLQQLDGLTWDIVGRSAVSLLESQGAWLAGLCVAAVVLLLTLRFVLTRAKPSSWRLGIVSLTGTAFLVAGIAANSLQATPTSPFIATGLLHSDINTGTALTAPARRAENQFFKQYHEDLKETSPTPRHPEVFESIRASNIIWVVLESVRAKESPLTYS